MDHATHLGMDVHRDTIAEAILRPDQNVPDERVIPKTPEVLRRLVARRRGTVVACYEARVDQLRDPPVASSLGVPVRRHRSDAHPSPDRPTSEDRSTGCPQSGPSMARRLKRPGTVPRICTLAASICFKPSECSPTPRRSPRRSCHEHAVRGIVASVSPVSESSFRTAG
jgi:hypothetical protein